MASYQVEFKASAFKELQKLPKPVIPRMIAAIAELAETPYPHGVKKPAGFEHTYRIRIGDYRVVYEVVENRLVIEIVRIRHRKDAYE